MNRADLRKTGFQGLAGMVLDKEGEIAVEKGQSTGRRVGSFLGRRPSITYLPAAAGRRIMRARHAAAGDTVRLRGRTRAKRNEARSRARGGLS